MSKAANICLSVVLAALVALAVSACGGDSDDPETASTSPTSASASQGAQEQSSSGSSKTDPQSSKFAQERAAAEAAIEGKPASGSAGQGTKQGARIKVPKGPREPAPTAEQRASATVASMVLKSPVLGPGPESVSPLPATYTCDGKDVPPPLAWQGVPAGTAELVLFALNLEPIDEAFFFDWAVAGIDPSLTGIDSGQLPKGAILGRNSYGKNGYSICPGDPETIIFALYALPGPSGARKGFDPAALRKEVLDASGNAGLLAVGYG